MFFRDFEKIDKWLLSLALVILVISMTLIINDGWLFTIGSQETAGLQRIGQVTSAERDVRRRFKTAFSWRPLHQRNEIYQGDSIFTGDESGAIIVTDRGEEISIAPNSLIVIDFRENSVLLNIDYGSISGRVGRDARLLIASREGTTEFSGDDALVQVGLERGRNLVVNVLEGEVELRSKQSTQRLRQHEEAEIGTGGRSREALPSLERTQFQPESFITPQKPLAAQDEALTIPQSIPELIAPQLVSAQTEFTLSPRSPTASFSQMAQLTSTTVAQNITRTPVLQWRTTPHASSYVLEISQDSQFKTILERHTLKHNRFTWSQVQPGVFFWRVRSQDLNERLSSYSNVGRLRVQVAPPQSTALKNIEEQVPDLRLMDSPPPPFELSWQAVPFAQSYEVEFDVSEHFSSPLKFQVSGLSRQVQAPRIGNYYWRVRALHNNRYISPFSDVYPLKYSRTYQNPETAGQLRALAPHAQETLVLVGQGEQTLRLHWTNPFPSSKYRLQVSRSPAFQSFLFDDLVEKNFYQFTQRLPDGWLYWRVRAENPHYVSPWTAASNFQVKYEGHAFDINAYERRLASAQPIPRAKAPTSSSPNTSKPHKSIDLEWRPIAFAKKYEVQISKTKDFAKIHHLYPSSHKLSLPLSEPGKYYWRVRALDKDGGPISAFSSTAFFTVCSSPDCAHSP